MSNRNHITPKGCRPGQSKLFPPETDDAWRIPAWVRRKIIEYDNSHVRSNDLLFGKRVEEKEVKRQLAVERVWNEVADAALRRLAESI